MDEMYENAQQTKYKILGSMKCKKFVMDEMYQISWVIAKFEYEYSSICVTSVVTA